MLCEHGADVTADSRISLHNEKIKSEGEEVHFDRSLFSHLLCMCCCGGLLLADGRATVSKGGDVSHGWKARRCWTWDVGR